MSRLRDLVAQAAAVAPRQAAKIEERARRIIGMEPGLEDQQDQAFGYHESVLAEAQSSLDDLQHALAPLSNNPPLERSTPLPASPVLIDGQAGVGDLNQPRLAAEAPQARQTASRDVADQVSSASHYSGS